MANVAQLIRRQSSRELLRVPLDRLELRELQHRLLPAPGDQAPGNLPLYGTANVAYLEEGSPSPSIQQVIFPLHSRLLLLLHPEDVLNVEKNSESLGKSHPSANVIERSRRIGWKEKSSGIVAIASASFNVIS